jgi:hypothetical protein
LELHLDRRWFLFEPWKAVVAAVLDLVWRTGAPTRIDVSPMSESWLRQHDLDYPKHADDRS